MKGKAAGGSDHPFDPSYPWFNWLKSKGIFDHEIHENDEMRKGIGHSRLLSLRAFRGFDFNHGSKG
jgi:hypothetical protein